MNILETILSSQNGAAVAEISKSLGLGQSETQSALGKKASGSDMLNAVLGGSSSPQPSQLSGLSAFLEFDKDGSVADDILGIAKKLL